MFVRSRGFNGWYSVRMDIREILKATLDDVEQAAVPDDLRAIAFREVIRHRIGQAYGPKAPGGPSRAAIPPTGASRDPETGSNSLDPDVAMAVLADETGIPEDELREVLIFTDSGEVGVLPPNRKLGANTSERARNVAILVVGARFAALKQRSIPLTMVRDACNDRGCYDSKNFKSSHLGKFDAINIRGNDVIVNPSKWLPFFKSAVGVARGASAGGE